jgi:hypothetical protein
VSTFPPRASVSLPPAEGVIALWEVDEMARTRCPSRILLASRAAAHLGDLPARRGRSALFLGRTP